MIDLEPDNSRPLIFFSYKFGSIFDKIKEYFRKRALRKRLEARNERARNARKSF